MSILQLRHERSYPLHWGQLGATAVIPRGRYIGKRIGDPPQEVAEHFIRCLVCGGWIDCRDLGHVFAHEGPLPQPAQDQPQ